MIVVLEKIGSAFLSLSRSFFTTLGFSGAVLIRIFSPKAYTSASLSVLLHQIYFTAVQILPFFLLISVILGTLLIGIAFQTIKSMGLDRFLGTVLVGFIITELSPFVTVLLLALRSSSAINTEVAVMKVNRELRTLEVFGIDVVDYLFLPRIMNGMISLTLLNGLFSVVLLASGFFFSFFIFGMDFQSYSELLAESIVFSSMIILVGKCIAFGFFITLIPIMAGTGATYDLTTIPVSVLHGMIRVFSAIIVVEVLSLLARFI
ncbi:MAG: ABC transporter permease [Deltaproteobacteria bacterium]|nr:ABC transporter permease [Deltaproteobacteria bacterium]